MHGGLNLDACTINMVSNYMYHIEQGHEQDGVLSVGSSSAASLEWIHLHCVTPSAKALKVPGLSKSHRCNGRP